MARTHIILDGLQDPRTARSLSARWADQGFINAVDVAAQCAWLAVRTRTGEEQPLTEADMGLAASTARNFGLEARDRVGQIYVPENDPAALRDRVVYEYKCRLATAVVFGLPAMALHYLGPVLAGGGTGTRSMLYPWLFEMLLVGWLCVASGWPILWQGGLSLAHGRITGDLLGAAVIVFSFVPSAVGVLSLIVADQPWFGSIGPAFHAAAAAVMLATAQRWLSHRHAQRLGGRANLMIPRLDVLLAAWLTVGFAVMTVMGWWVGIAFWMLMPIVMGTGSISPWSPGWSAALPVIAIAVWLAIGPVIGLSLHAVEIEAASGFGAIMTIVFAVGWRRFA